MKKTPSPSSRNLLLFVASLISLMAQGFWLAPERLNFLLQYLAVMGNILPGTIFLALALLIYVSALRSASANNTTRLLAVILISIQFTAAVGMLFLQEGPASRLGEAGFVVSSLITALTSLAVYLNTASAKEIGNRTPPTNEGAPASRATTTDTTEGLKEQVSILNRRLETEKRRSIQLTLLNELSRQLEADLEPEVAAQLTVNTLERVIDCTVVTLMMYEPDRQKFLVLTSAGEVSNRHPQGYQQESTHGLFGRINRLKKTQVINDTQSDPEFAEVRKSGLLSIIGVPILQHSQVRSVLEIGADKPHAFSPADAAIAEDVATELAHAWQRYSYHQRLRELIQAGVSLTTLLDPQAAVQEISMIATGLWRRDLCSSPCWINRVTFPATHPPEKAPGSSTH